MKNVYVLRNRVASFYLDPFIKVEDKEQIKVDFSRACILDRDMSIKNHFNECEVYLLGTYDDLTGTYNLLPEKEFLIDLGQYFVEKAVN